MASLAGTAQVAQAEVKTQDVAVKEVKATVPKRHEKKVVVENTIGDIPLITYMPNYGMSPKEYGMRYGHGNGKGKSNRLRLAHNAKLKRRLA